MSDLAWVDVSAGTGVRVVRVHGEIDLSNAREVMEAVAGQAGEALRVVVDLSDTAYVDSAGISMLFRLAERLGCRRQQLRLVVPANAPIRAAFELTRLPDVIPVDETLAEGDDGTGR